MSSTASQKSRRFVSTVGHLPSYIEMPFPAMNIVRPGLPSEAVALRGKTKTWGHRYHAGRPLLSTCQTVEGRNGDFIIHNTGFWPCAEGEARISTFGSGCLPLDGGESFGIGPHFSLADIDSPLQRFLRPHSNPCGEHSYPRGDVISAMTRQVAVDGEHLKTRLSALEPGCASTLPTWDCLL
jgi:hypothetical protein